MYFIDVKIGVVASCSFRQSQFPEQRGVAGIVAQLGDQRVGLDEGQPAIVLGVGAIEPLEGLVLFATPSVDLGDLVGGALGILGDLLAQGLLRFLGMAQRVLGHGHAGAAVARARLLTGSDYDDTLIGMAGSNTLTGGAGNDILEGMAGADNLIGGAGSHDVASYARAGLPSSGSDTTAPGQGVVASLTTLFPYGPAVTTSGDAAGDTYSGIEDMVGSNYNDTLIGDTGINILNGGTGDDKLEGMGGADILIGGTGSDLNNTASYAHAGPVSGSTGVTVSLDNPNINTGEAQGDTYFNIRHLEGSAFNDLLQGDA